MNELKFTPGPWESIPNDNMIRVKPQKDQGYLGGLYICHIEKFLPDILEEAHKILKKARGE